ncbi:MAG: AraC family transcriptional regulator [Chloroflexota bacterium]
MTYQAHNFKKLADLVEEHTPQEGINVTAFEHLGTYKAYSTQPREPEIDIPASVIVLQGQKVCFLGGKKYIYEPGKVLLGLYPAPVETELLEASPDKPYLAVGVALDMGRMTEMLLRIDQFDETAPQPVSGDLSAKITMDLNDQILDSFIRLFSLLAQPRDAFILGDAMVDEIYYRLLCDEHSGELRSLLQQKGKIRRISKAIDYIHANLDQPVSVEKLAEVVLMSRTNFYLNFKEVMHVSPLQYAKSVKLFEAQKLLKEGMRVGEACDMVGYNNLGQFSREYKRQFGVSPSATAA